MSEVKYWDIATEYDDAELCSLVAYDDSGDILGYISIHNFEIEREAGVNIDKEHYYDTRIYKTDKFKAFDNLIKAIKYMEKNA